MPSSFDALVKIDYICVLTVIDAYMKKLFFLAVALFSGLMASAQDPYAQPYGGDMVEQHRAAVEVARRAYEEKSETGSQRIDELESTKRAHEEELSRVQEDYKFAKEREKNLNRSLKLNQQKLSLQRKTGADQYSRDMTNTEIRRLRNELKQAKADVKEISQVVKTKKEVVAEDKKAISEVKKSISDAKQEVKQREKYLKQSQKLQQKMNQNAAM